MSRSETYQRSLEHFRARIAMSKPQARGQRPDGCQTCDAAPDDKAERAKAADAAKRAAKFRGKIVVIMPCRNEGDWPVRTIRSFRKSKAPGTELQFVVVDDGSDDDALRKIRRAPDIRYLRADLPNGQGVSRSIAVYLFRGADGYVSIDSHEELRKPHVLEQIVINAQETGGIVGTLSGAMMDDKPDTTLSAIGKSWRAFDQLGFWQVGTDSVGRTGEYLQPIQILRGACYAFTEETFDRLGGFGESYGYYGFFERDLSVNCAFLGVPQFVNTRVRSWHYYRKQRPYFMAGRWLWWGYIECWRQRFRQKVWRKWLMPAAEDMAKRLDDPMMYYLLRTPKLDVLQAAYEAKKKRSDEQVLRWMGFPIEEAS